MQVTVSQAKFILRTPKAWTPAQTAKARAVLQLAHRKSVAK